MAPQQIYASVKQQINVFKQMQEELGRNMDKLTPEEKEELEGYIDNQKRQCELFLKLEPKIEIKPDPKPAEEKPKPKPAKKEEPKEETPADDFDDLLG